ncbi:OmpA family protein [Granulosicoccus antarcticus]|uniref:Outer membrane porin F n=1 Tax=Granulosicoccus antarcticus IMCC3135 TaxID=1192854 RepID=A0A2Z2NNC3_9GAMM|nr:OmpA family protein [Granulosicoccus antarcticus]ASJ71431.1 Outer membrane porin F [Granulosicoccus antarcticus IMCC3135]
MLNKIAYKIALAGLLASLSGTASALGDQWYLGIGGGISTLKPDIVDTSIDVSDENGQVGTLFIGRDFDNRSSGQLQLYSLGDAQYGDEQSSAGYTGGDASLLYRFYDSRDSKPRGTLFGAALYGRFGFGFMQRDSDLLLDTDTPVYFGAGAGIETFLTFNLAVRLEALYHDTDVTSATLTLVNRFGGRRPSALPSTAVKPIISPVTEAETELETAVTSNTTQKDAVAISAELPETYIPPPAGQPAIDTELSTTDTAATLPETIDYDVPDSAGAPIDLAAQPGMNAVPGSAEAPIELTPLPDLNDSDTAISQIPEQLPESIPAPIATPAIEPPETTPIGDSGFPEVKLMGDSTKNTLPAVETPELAEIDIATDTVPDVEIMGTATETQTKPEVVVPPTDTDADGITDELDKCPDSTPGYPVTARGCPVFGGMLPELTFNEQTADLSSTSYAVLDTLVQQLLDFPDTYIELVAHTDNTGTEAQQSELTRQRLRSIGVYLVRHGVSQDRLLLRSYGGSRPNFDNTTTDGRRRNNRIEVLENP